MQNLYKRVCEVGVLPGGQCADGGRKGTVLVRSRCRRRRRRRRSPRPELPLLQRAPSPTPPSPTPPSCPLQYLEYDTRVEVLNNRFQVLQEMLDM